MAPEVIQTLIGRVPKGKSAQILGTYKRHPVQHFVFPGLIRCSSATNTDVSSSAAPDVVRGIFYNDLSATEMTRLDRFEGDDYVKEPCTVRVLGDDDDNNNDDESSCYCEKQGIVYLWARPATELDVANQWSFETFREKHLKDYLRGTARPCRDELDRVLND